MRESDGLRYEVTNTKPRKVVGEYEPDHAAYQRFIALQQQPTRLTEELPTTAARQAALLANCMVASDPETAPTGVAAPLPTPPTVFQRGATTRPAPRPRPPPQPVVPLPGQSIAEALEEAELRYVEDFPEEFVGSDDEEEVPSLYAIFRDVAPELLADNVESDILREAAPELLADEAPGDDASADGLPEAGIAADVALPRWDADAGKWIHPSPVSRSRPRTSSKQAGPKLPLLSVLKARCKARRLK